MCHGSRLLSSAQSSRLCRSQVRAGDELPQHGQQQEPLHNFPTKEPSTVGLSERSRIVSYRASSRPAQATLSPSAVPHCRHCPAPERESDTHYELVLTLLPRPSLAPLQPRASFVAAHLLGLAFSALPFDSCVFLDR